MHTLAGIAIAPLCCICCTSVVALRSYLTTVQYFGPPLLIVIAYVFLGLPFQAGFVVTLGPFVFFNVQKTKYLQMFTTALRWLGKSTSLNTQQHTWINNGGSDTCIFINWIGRLYTRLKNICIFIYLFLFIKTLPNIWVNDAYDKWQVTNCTNDI